SSVTRSPTPGHGHGHSEVTALFLEGKRRRARGFDTLKVRRPGPVSWPAVAVAVRPSVRRLEGKGADRGVTTTGAGRWRLAGPLGCRRARAACSTGRHRARRQRTGDCCSRRWSCLLACLLASLADSLACWPTGPPPPPRSSVRYGATRVRACGRRS